MPGLARRNDQWRNDQYSNVSFGFWSTHSDAVGYNQLQKFWSDLSLQARQELLRIDKQTLFEQARKNMYCSRCNGLLLEGFLQIVMHGKSLQQEGAANNLPCNRPGVSKRQNDGGSSLTNGLSEETQDPSVHPWGGLTTTRDGSLTLLDCYLYSKSLKGLQNVFDSARLRERERELHYPDACGGGGRGWISQGFVSYGRGHGTRETCALHTARLSCDTLVEFWSALGEETQQSLLRMKEEDFIERLMYRFDSKRFCRDCRRNVIREFKELKELKRMRRETRCTSWFCVADTAFQYEISDDMVQVDWHQTFADAVGTYHHFEWAIGTGEGKCDIMEFENVGMSGSVHVNGLDLGGLSACYITLRACKSDDRCIELSVKAHALKGQQCVHCRLVVGDGYVTITRGESIRKFFEHAEEAEEEEDDDSMDKDGNELDGECFRPQKHAKSPELAREFLLDAATVIFKEQVEKAFREGTARQNAHSIFVCLALKLLEERVHVACKEIITLEKQMKLLEEEEKEKREEEERKERRRTKEREKKLRRRERLKEKEREKEKRCPESNLISVLPNVSKEESSPVVDGELSNAINCKESVSEFGYINRLRPGSPDIEEEFLNDCTSSSSQNHSSDSPDSEGSQVKDGSGSFTMEESKFSHRRSKFQKEAQFDPSLKWSDRRQFTIASENGPIHRSESRCQSESFEVPSRGTNGSNRQLRINATRSIGRTCGLKYGEKFHCSNGRGDRYDSYSFSCSQKNKYRIKGESHVSALRAGQEPRSVSKPEFALDMSKQLYPSHKYNQVEFMHEDFGRVKGKTISGNNSHGWDSLHLKKVWGPTESQQKYSRSNSDSAVTLMRSSTFNNKGVGSDNNISKSSGNVVSSGDVCSCDTSGNSGEIDQEDSKVTKSRNFSHEMNGDHQNELQEEAQIEASYEKDGLCPSRNFTLNVSSDPLVGSTNSDSCSSCLGEGDGNGVSPNHGNMESSSTSDSEDASLKSDARDASVGTLNGFSECQEQGIDKKLNINGGDSLGSQTLLKSLDGTGSAISGNMLMKTAGHYENGISTVTMGTQHQSVFPPTHNQHTQFPVYQDPSTMGYYPQNAVTWPATSANGLMVLPPPNHYLYSGLLGYGLNGNSPLCMQYGALPHLATPLFNPGPAPLYQPVAKANGFHSEEHTQISKPAEAKAPAGTLPTETAACQEGNQIDNSSNLQTGNSNFSLFHFGPVAFSTGCKSDLLSSKDGIVGELSSQFSTDHVDNSHAGSKKENRIEEYNLFAASNGITSSLMIRKFESSL
ncbi:hypothetical protein SLE2022_138580 [Rubroshorea leprosula]